MRDRLFSWIDVPQHLFEGTRPDEQHINSAQYFFGPKVLKMKNVHSAHCTVKEKISFPDERAPVPGSGAPYVA